ncbi:unnamed protein product, partial [Amoebophrya sp. A25]
GKTPIFESESCVSSPDGFARVGGIVEIGRDEQRGGDPNNESAASGGEGHDKSSLANAAEVASSGTEVARSPSPSEEQANTKASPIDDARASPQDEEASGISPQTQEERISIDSGGANNAAVKQSSQNNDKPIIATTPVQELQTSGPQLQQNSRPSNIVATAPTQRYSDAVTALQESKRQSMQARASARMASQMDQILAPPSSRASRLMALSGGKNGKHNLQPAGLPSRTAEAKKNAPSAGAPPNKIKIGFEPHQGSSPSASSLHRVTSGASSSSSAGRFDAAATSSA